MTTSEHVFVLKQISHWSVGYLSNVGLAQFCKNPSHRARKDLMHLTAAGQNVPRCTAALDGHRRVRTAEQRIHTHS